MRGPTAGRRISIRRPGQAQPPPGTAAATRHINGSVSAVCRPAALRLRGPTVGRRISIRRPGQVQPPPGT
ncbi:hypothetical protein EOL24_02025 [Klebsiella pneumoniae]|nr:hypothetical protein EOL24_02025 [Klebsiella pneumoniae]